MNFKSMIEYAKNNQLSQYILETKKSRELADFLPEIDCMDKYEQSPKHHPEGDVFTHTIKALQYHEQKGQHGFIVPIAILFHDIGKPATHSYDEKGNVHHYCHEQEGAELFMPVAKRLGISQKLAEIIHYCIKQHLRYHKMLHFSKMNKIFELVSHEYFLYLRAVSIADAACRGKNASNYESHRVTEQFVDEFCDWYQLRKNEEISHLDFDGDMIDCHKKYKDKFKQCF